MKIKQLFLAAMTMLAFSACTFIPEPPYQLPENGGSGTTSGDYYINETFASSFGSFSTQQTVGNYPWVIDYSTAKATSYVNDVNNAATSWLVSSPVDFTNETEAYVAFDYIIRYSESGKVANNHQLLISANYSGDAAAATWTDLPYNAVEGSDWATFYKANVSVPAEFLGKSGITFALRYTATSKSSTWEVKNFKVAHGTAEVVEPEEATEYTVSEALAAFTGAAKPAIVKGYIVGTINGQVYTEGCVFSGTAESMTNLLIADNADETDYNNCMPVQLPSGAVRNALNLVENPGNYKKFVTLTGSLEKYFGVPGLKSVTKYSIDGVTPDGPETPDTPEVDGENLLDNSDFEIWENNKPQGWGLTVTNGTYSQSSDAHSGVSSVLIEGYASSNKRMASKSYTLKAGTYTLAAYLKSTGDATGQFRLGYAKLTDGVVADTQNDYIYISSAAPVPSTWEQSYATFTLETETEIAIIIMNSKYGEGASILVDDVTLSTTDGGIVEGTGSEEPETPETPAGTYISEAFTNGFGSFTTQETIGNYPWVSDVTYGAKASGYANGASQDAESWLISPAINFANETAAYIAFDYVINKGEISAAAANHKLLITSNYTGDVATTQWTEVNFGAVNNNNWTFHNTGDIALPESMMGKTSVVFAFKYISTTANSSTWEIKNVVVASGSGITPDTPETPDQPETPEEPETPDTPTEPNGDNLLENSSFEAWSNGLPTGWGKDGSNATAHSATISQSADAHTGSYAVNVSGNSSSNKRLASKSYTLPAGTYTLSAYIKQSGSTTGSFRLGYAMIKNNAIANSDFKYLNDVTNVTSEWKLYTYEFTLTEETLVSALVMNSKVGNGAAILVDDVTITAK